MVKTLLTDTSSYSDSASRLQRLIPELEYRFQNLQERMATRLDAENLGLNAQPMNISISALNMQILV